MNIFEILLLADYLKNSGYVLPAGNWFNDLKE